MDRLPRLAIDVSPLRDAPDFRRLWMALAISQLGTRMTMVAVPFQIFALTRSTAAVGLMGLISLVPLLTLTVVGGAIADSLDRRRLMLLTEAGGAVAAVALAANASLGRPHLWAVYVLGVTGVSLFALGVPASRSSVPSLVGTDKVAAAMALKACASRPTRPPSACSMPPPSPAPSWPARPAAGPATSDITVPWS